MSKKSDRKSNDKKAAPKDEPKVKAPNEKSYLARVYVSLKPTVNDPEGITIGNALGSLGFSGVDGVRSGRYFQVTLRATGAKDAETAVDQMCSRLLANPVIETYSFEIGPI
jgi:phosphoribosylformylglycinamidine synthase subunit PurS